MSGLLDDARKQAMEIYQLKREIEDLRERVMRLALDVVRLNSETKRQSHG